MEELASAKALGQGLVWSRNSRRQEWPEQKWDRGADWLVEGFHLVGENSNQGSVERFQTENRRYGTYSLVNGIETVGQAGVTVEEDRVSGCSHAGGLVKTRVLALPRECVFVEVHGQAGATGPGPPLRTTVQIKDRTGSRDLGLQL